MKITMVGKSGSGKTTYMAGLHQRLGSSRAAGFYITPSAKSFSQAIETIGNFEDLSFGSRDFRFPPGTVRTTLWSFDFFHGRDFVSDFQWIDYRGGILEDFTSPDLSSDTEKKAQVDELMGHLEISNAVLIFCDAIQLTSYGNLEQARLHSGAKIINTLFRLYSIHHPYSNLSLVILLSKADSDLIEPKWKNDNYHELIQRGLEAFDEITDLAVGNQGRWTGGILPVGSVGEGNVRSRAITPADFRNPVTVSDAIVGFPDPLNVHHPLFFCVGNTLQYMKNVAEANVEDYERRVEAALANSGALRDIWLWISNSKNPRTLARELASQKSSEKRIVSRIARHLDPLYEEAKAKITRI